MKRAILLMIALMTLGGCAYGASKSYWIKDGERVPSEQAQREFAQCRGPLWSKVEMADYEKDFESCAEADRARDKHVENTKTALAIGGFLTIGVLPVWVACAIAESSISNKDYFRRCMQAKGYRPTETKAEELDQCMKDKGYEWK